MPVESMQGQREAVLFEALVGAARAFTWREQTIQVHRRWMRTPILHAGTITFLDSLHKKTVECTIITFKNVGNYIEVCDKHH